MEAGQRDDSCGMMELQEKEEPTKGAMTKELPKWHYNGTSPQLHQQLPGENVTSLPSLTMENDDNSSINLGDYTRKAVTNVDATVEGRRYFDMGLRLMLSYQHEMAARCFLACLQYSPDAALAHGLLSLCHAPNYNFKGAAYYESTFHVDDLSAPHDLLCVFPSQQVAERHSAAGVAKVEELKRLHKKSKNKNQKQSTSNRKKKGRNYYKPQNSSHDNDGDDDKKLPDMISDVEAQLLSAIRILMGTPGVDPDLVDETVGRPYANAMRRIHQKYPTDPEVAYFFAEALMVPNAWQLYEYPSGKPVCADVVETGQVLERALQLHPEHAGLCHMYVHLSEMSAQPEKALTTACRPLRTQFPHAGHLIHMPTHIDVLVGDYESCVEYNVLATAADRHVMQSSPATAGKESFYFGYIVHNYHMAVYGAILGGMEAKARQVATELNAIVNEDMFREFPNLVSYLESYAALDIHILVRFGRWKEILRVPLPQDKYLMLFRAASLYYARALAYAMTANDDGDADNNNHMELAFKEADRFDSLRNDHPEANARILHNNSVADLLAVDAVMMRGELAYRGGRHQDGLALLRRAVEMQDNLNYDEPWGKMQPIRHALGGLLLEQQQIEEATRVFRKDLKFHPKNPWALVGLIRCLKLQKQNGSCGCATTTNEIEELEEQLRVQRQMKWADFDVVVPCECCVHPSE